MSQLDAPRLRKLHDVVPVSLALSDISVDNGKDVVVALGFIDAQRIALGAPGVVADERGRLFDQAAGIGRLARLDADVDGFERQQAAEAIEIVRLGDGAFGDDQKRIARLGQRRARGTGPLARQAVGHRCAPPVAVIVAVVVVGISHGAPFPRARRRHVGRRGGRGEDPLGQEGTAP